jgi:hypothetical protein
MARGFFREKATDLVVDRDFLHERTVKLGTHGYKKSRWIEFCEAMLDQGYTVSLYEARATVSKYLTVTHPESRAAFKVRFSNHKPNYGREVAADCDFFVGRNHLGTTTTEMAIEAVLNSLGPTRKVNQCQAPD